MEATLLHQAAEVLREKITAMPTVGIILGSGLGDLAKRIENPVVVPYKDVPGMRVSTAPGHAGQFVIGQLSGKTVICMQGRLHFYEGYPMSDIAFPIRLMRLMGVTELVVTNACGAVERTMKPGDLCLLTDHINMLGTNPMIGPNPSEFGPRFFDMSKAYNPELRALAMQVAREQNVSLREGVYLAYFGPSYETPAEIRAFRMMGADLVGMSTVPEVIVAHHCGIRTLAISLVTNMAAGILDVKLDEQEVIDTAAERGAVLQNLVAEIIRRI